MQGTPAQSTVEIGVFCASRVSVPVRVVSSAT
jgi:hypothetical protein